MENLELWQHTAAIIVTMFLMMSTMIGLIFRIETRIRGDMGEMRTELKQNIADLRTTA